jgi:formamidopyrimidine-DNA glycosylase
MYFGRYFVIVHNNILFFSLVQPASKPPISELGPDALLEPMTVDELHGSLSKKKVAIKALLLDQVKIYVDLLYYF